MKPARLSPCPVNSVGGELMPAGLRPCPVDSTGTSSRAHGLRSEWRNIQLLGLIDHLPGVEKWIGQSPPARWLA